MQSFSTVYGTHCGAGYVAKVLGVSVGTVHGLIRSGRLHAWRTKGGHHQISLSCLQKYVAELGLPTSKIMINTVSAKFDFAELIKFLKDRYGSKIQILNAPK
ncbi:MAG: hypothetical protein RIT15_1136 [Pseudomonadota bacterium]|jgi:excisionase family DNA binding protein